MEREKPPSGRKVHLPCGKDVTIFVHHQKDAVLRRPEKPKYPIFDKDGKRVKSVVVLYAVPATSVKMVMDGLEYESFVRCSPDDRYGPLQGRKLAANRLLALIGDTDRFPNLPFTKYDRHVIFMTICPEYAHRPIDRKVRRKARNVARQLLKHPDRMDQIMAENVVTPVAKEGA